MVKLALQIKLTLENLSEIGVANSDEEKFQWHFEIKCTSCQELHPRPLICNTDDVVEVAGSKGSTVHVQMKCNFCKREMSLSFDGPVQTYKVEEDAETFKTIVLLECRGLEVTRWLMSEGFRAKVAETGELFQGIDLSEDFYEYSESLKAPVSVTEVETKIIKVK